MVNLTCVCCPAGIHSFADMYSCRDLENASRRFVYQHFQEVIGTEEFFLLAEADVVDLLRSDQLQVCWIHSILPMASLTEDKLILL